jgi:hypothetical protein
MASTVTRSMSDRGENLLSSGIKRPFRRGKRGARVGARLTSRHTPGTESAQRKGKTASKRGMGSRAAHFMKCFEKSVERAVPIARQIADIKSRAETRRSVNRTALPPRAAAGLGRRQARLVQMSRRWGDAFAASAGEESLSGRRFWRSKLYRACRTRDLDVEESSTLFGTEVSAVTITPERALVQDQEVDLERRRIAAEEASRQARLLPAVCCTARNHDRVHCTSILCPSGHGVDAGCCRCRFCGWERMGVSWGPAPRRPPARGPVSRGKPLEKPGHSRGPWH